MSAISSQRILLQLFVIMLAFSLAYGCAENDGKQSSTPDPTVSFYTPDARRIIDEFTSTGGAVRGWKRDGILVALRVTQATDARLSRLKDSKDFAGLERLHLSQAQLTDAGLAHLKELAGLKTLYLQGGRITDGGLEHLKELANLENLTLYATEVTDQGVKELKKALPKLKVSKLTSNPEADRWVGEQVKRGRTADLELQFDNKADRVLSASFLQHLLTSTPKDPGVIRPKLVIKNAVLVEPIDLSLAKIPYETSLISCDFKEEVNVRGSHFHRSLRITSSWFTKVNFDRMKVEGTLNASNARFTSLDEEASFHAINVGMIILANARFDGPVDFASAETGRDFIADGTNFTNPDKEVYFNGMKVGRSFSLRSAKFEGLVDFVGAAITRQFLAQGAKFSNKQKRVTFNSMTVRDGAFFNPVKEVDDFPRGVERRVGEKVVFAGPVSFANARIGSMYLSNVTWPDSIELGGMDYDHISMGYESVQDELESLKELADRSKYHRSVYLNLEAFFQRGGYKGQANDVFFAMKRRQREEEFRGVFGFFAKAGSWFLYVFVGYGRYPLLALGWGLLIVVLNYLTIFRHQDGMELQKREEVNRKYNGFWYSLDHFLPFIDLQAAKVWIPKQERWFARNWIRVHTILGWILISIGLVAVTGIAE